MGAVYLARQTDLDRLVVIKVILDEGEAGTIERFQREARAAAQIASDNVVAVLETGVEQGIHYIAMEYVEGRSAADRLREKGRLEWVEATQVVAAAARGLAAAHARGILHRDVKPGNILIARDGRVKIADFGLARVASSGLDPALTGSGTIVGTPHYMSPEQADARPLDARSDLYSLGVSYFELLTGKRPFEGESTLATLSLIFSAPTPSVRQLVPSTPASVDRACARLMAREREKRPATASDAAELLARIASIAVPDHPPVPEGPGSPARPAAPPPPPATSPASRGVSGRFALVVLGAAVLLGTALALLAGQLGGQPGPPAPPGTPAPAAAPIPAPAALPAPSPAAAAKTDLAASPESGAVDPEPAKPADPVPATPPEPVKKEAPKPEAAKPEPAKPDERPSGPRWSETQFDAATGSCRDRFKAATSAEDYQRIEEAASEAIDHCPETRTPQTILLIRGACRALRGDEKGAEADFEADRPLWPKAPGIPRIASLCGAWLSRDDELIRLRKQELGAPEEVAVVGRLDAAASGRAYHEAKIKLGNGAHSEILNLLVHATLVRLAAKK
jgi:serine/threonine-protein kinase